MRRLLFSVCLALAARAAAFEPGDSPALRQAGNVGEVGAGPVYDNAAPHGGGVSAVSGSGGTKLSALDLPCYDETCGFRRGGPPPASLKHEPDTPFTDDVNKDGTPKKSTKMSTWAAIGLTALGMAAGAAVGFIIGGWVGALIGAAIGGLLGFLLPKLF